MPIVERTSIDEGEEHVEAPSQEQIEQADLELQATRVGWEPEDKFHGKPGTWVDAKTYLERAQHVMPFLKENNKKLQEALTARDKQIADLAKRQEEADRALAVLEAANNEQSVEATEERIAQTREALKLAVQEQDVEKQVELSEALADLKAELKAAKNAAEERPVEKKPTAAPAISPETERAFNEWLGENEWYKKPAMAGAANAIAVEIQMARKAAGETPLLGRALLDEMTKRMDEEFNISRRPPESRVENSRRSTARREGSTGRYSDLPAEAKAACDKDAKRFVGDNKRYKDVASWRAKYAEIYFKQQGAQ